MVVTTSEAQTQTKLDHLWRLSHTIVATVPQLSVHYQEVLHRITAADHQTIADATQRRCCTHCGIPRVPGQTTRVRVSQRKSRNHPQQSVSSTGEVATTSDIPGSNRQKTTHPSSSHLRYIGRPFEQRPKGQSVRLHSARDVDMTCLLCGGITRYGGATRAELQKISALSNAVNTKRQSRKRKRQPAPIINSIQVASTSTTSTTKQTCTVNEHLTVSNQVSAPVTVSIDMMQSSKVVSSNTQLKQQLGQCQMNQKTSTSVEMKASSISTQSMNTTAKKPALPASNSQVNQKCDKKSGKKHALGKLLDKGRQQRNEENAKKSVSLNDFLMDFN